MKCRHCHAPLELDLVDLGSSPPSNSYLSVETLNGKENWFPLRVKICDKCWLVQTQDFADREVFFSEDYAYFSSTSKSWLAHAADYSKKMTDRFGLASSSMVVEIASNDGYLLKNFVAAGIGAKGVEPTLACAEAAKAAGVDTIVEFFGVELAQKMVAAGDGADLMAANNVLAHVPDINDFVSGFRVLLKPAGVATFEFPHLVNMIAENQFDTIYHEHYSYLSLSAVKAVFETNGLEIFDVEEISTHGGSLRVFAQRADTGKHAKTEAVDQLLAAEQAAGVRTLAYYLDFQQKSEKVKDDFLQFLLEKKREGKKVAAYGAAAKGNTLMNFAGIRPDLIKFVVDLNPVKAGKFMPGSRIPIVAEAQLSQYRPDYIVILPWNLYEEISAQLHYTKDWGAKFVTAVPELKIN